jgi:hypothetical protein
MQVRETDRIEQERRALQSINGDIATAAAAIHDDDLRRRFLLAAGSCIDRRESEP